MVHSCVGLTVVFYRVFLIFIIILYFPLWLGPLFVSGGSDLTYTCAWRRSCLLVTNFSIIASIVV